MSVALRFLALGVLVFCHTVPAFAREHATASEVPQLPGEGKVSLDLFVFSQNDDGANPVRDENLGYRSLRIASSYRTSRELGIHGSIAVAEIDGGGFEEDQLQTVVNALSTRSSEDEDDRPLTVDFGAELTPPGSIVTYRSSLHYFYQDSFESRGFDAGASAQLNEGNTVPSINFSFRWERKELLWWNDMNQGWDSRRAFGATLGLTQIVTDRFVLTGSAQYSLQQGFLHESRNPVALYTGNDPTVFTDERLPRRRERYQVNLRGRYALSRAWALGLDTSYYEDSWEVSHYALEPSAAWQATDWLNLRAYFRYSDQDGTKYFRERPTQEVEFQTQDSDLGSFSSFGGGLALKLNHDDGPLGMDWRYKITAFGHQRDDDLSGIGLLVGVETRF